MSRRAECHPDRDAWAGTVCGECGRVLEKRYKAGKLDGVVKDWWESIRPQEPARPRWVPVPFKIGEKADPGPPVKVTQDVAGRLAAAGVPQEKNTRYAVKFAGRYNDHLCDWWASIRKEGMKVCRHGFTTEDPGRRKTG